MLSLNLQNVEELILSDKRVRNLLPELRPFFDQWLFSQRVAYLRSLRVRSQMGVLNALTPEHLEKLETYFQDTLILNKIDCRIVKNTSFPLDFNPEGEFDGFGNLAISRDESHMYVTCWR